MAKRTSLSYFLSCKSRVRIFCDSRSSPASRWFISRDSVTVTCSTLLEDPANIATTGRGPRKDLSPRIGTLVDDIWGIATLYLLTQSETLGFAVQLLTNARAESVRSRVRRATSSSSCLRLGSCHRRVPTRSEEEEHQVMVKERSEEPARRCRR